MPHHAHSIDRWDDAKGSNLYEHLAGVNNLFWPGRLSRLPSSAGPEPRSRCVTVPASLTRLGRLTTKCSVNLAQSAWIASRANKKHVALLYQGEARLPGTRGMTRTPRSRRTLSRRASSGQTSPGAPRRGAAQHGKNS
jgi:hypothetical protein